MKKILISILFVLLIVLAGFLIAGNIQLVGWENKNINDIKNTNEKLKEQIEIAKQVNNQEYPQTVDEIESSIKNLKIEKEKYESKVNYISEDVELGIVEIKEYKIEHLWIVLQNYAKKENVELKLDLLETSAEGVYDLDITVVGEYIGITDFIYNLEKDDTLGFKISNFKLVPSTSTTTTTQTNNKEDDEETNADENTDENTEKNEDNDEDSKSSSSTTTSVSVNKLKATFKVTGVGIEFN